MAGGDNNPSIVEWELSKENVQPLRHGRKVTNLTAALQPLDGDQLSRIKEQRQHFESELRTYEGDDPLDVWFRYIKWTEENYPKGGKDGHMMTLLEKCVTLFKNEEIYQNDQRYLDIWIKFASFSLEPLEVFTFLYDQGIGCELATLFEAWTWELEQVGNTKKADALFQEGIHRGAQPLNRLVRSYREFEVRTVRNAAAGQFEAAMTQPPVEERTACGELKGHGKRQVVGSVRIGAAKQAPRASLKMRNPVVQQRGAAFPIYNDENQMTASSVPPQTGEWTTVPTRAATQQENDQAPGVWSKAKVPQKSTGVVPISSFSNYRKPSFTVHTDENVEQKLATPLKSPGFGNHVLSAHKPKEQQNTVQHLNQMTAQDTNEVPMYKKQLVYSGIEEYQFEEMRQAKWREKMEERRRREEHERLREEQEMFREEVRRHTEALRQREAELQRKQEEFMSQIKNEIARFNSSNMSSSEDASISEHVRLNENNISVRQPRHSVTHPSDSISCSKTNIKPYLRRPVALEEPSEQVTAVGLNGSTHMSCNDENGSTRMPCNDENGSTPMPCMDENGSTHMPYMDENRSTPMPCMDENRSTQTPCMDENRSTQPPCMDENRSKTPCMDENRSKRPCMDENRSAQTPCMDENRSTQTPCMDENRSTQTPCMDENRSTQMPCMDENRSTQPPCMDENRSTQMPCMDENRSTQTPCMDENRSAQTPCMDENRSAQTPCMDENRSTQPPCMDENRSTQMPCMDENRSTQMPCMDENRSAQTPCMDENRSAQMPCMDENRSTQTPCMDEKDVQLCMDENRSTQTPCMDENRSTQMPCMDENRSTPMPCMDENRSTQMPCMDENRSTQMPCMDENRSTQMPCMDENRSTQTPCMDENRSTQTPCMDEKDVQPCGDITEQLGTVDGDHTSNTPTMNLKELVNSGKSSGKSFSSSQTPDSAPDLTSANKRSLTRCIGGASLTMNTKEAFEAVMGMFRDGTVEQLQFGFTNASSQRSREEEGMDTISSGKSAPFGNSGVPFKIFSENSFSKPTTGLPHPHFKVKDCNDENRAPFGYNQPKRKAVAGILQPAAGVASRKGIVLSNQSDEEEQMDGVEFHYRDDITMAPLGSEMDFAAAARCASTPFNVQDRSDSFKRGEEMEDVVFQKNPMDLGEGENGAEHQSVSSSHTAEGVKKYSAEQMMPELSPILELSEDDVKSVTAGSNTTNHASHVETKAIIEHKNPVLKLKDIMSQSISPVNLSYHLIDTSGYIATEDKTEALSTSIAIDPRDPFDQQVIERFLRQLPEPISTYPGYNSLDKPLPEIKLGQFLFLGKEAYSVKEKLGEGGFAKVFLVSQHNVDADPEDLNRNDCVLKIQSPPCQWEFYICNTVHKRLAALNSPVDVSASMMSVEKAYFCEDYSCLVNRFHQNGTLLDLVNFYRGMPSYKTNLEPFAMFVTIELLQMMEQLHKCSIIHGDIKPDNFLLRKFVSLPEGTDVNSVFGTSTQMLKLIDFGQSIDMTLYPPGTTFTAKVQTSGFQCIEMKTDQPWTYQTDLFGLIGTIHVVVFTEYMKVFQEGGRWKTTSSFPRSWNGPLWKELFDALLNIPSCTELPDLSHYRQKFQEYFVASLLPGYRAFKWQIDLRSATSVNSGSNHMSVGHSQLSALSQTSGITVTLENPAQETPREPTPPPAEVLAENEFKLCKNCGALSKQIRMCESCGKTITMRDKTVTSYETVKPNILSGSKPKCQPRPPVHPNILTKRSFYGQKLQEQSQAYGGSLLTCGKDCGGGVQINSRRGKTAKQLSGAKVVPETVTISSDEEDSVTDSGNQLNNSRAIMNSSDSDSASASGIMTNNSSVSANNENDSQHQNNTQTTSSEPDQSETSAMTDDLDSTNSEFGNISVFNVKRKVGMRRDRMEDSSGNVPAKRRKTTKKKQVQEESVEFLLKEPSVTLNVRCVRIGTLKGVPVEPVFLSKEGFFVKMECSESCCEIKIALTDLENIAYHLQKRLSVIYMNVSTTCGLRLRKELKTCSTQDEFFDPDTSELARKFIIFFLESQLEKEEFNTLMTLFHHFERLKPHREEFLQALSYEEAQIVLRQISNTSAATINSPSPTESPQSKSFLPEDPVPVLEESTAEMCPGTVGKLFTYQPASDRGAISITTEDLLCLRDGEFLNDVIIDFYLKYLMNEVFSEENKQRTYVFSSFFYTRLTQKQTRLSVKEKSQVDLKVWRHDMVKTWTRRVDLFAKDFIIVPINEHSHWFLAIICFPGLVKNKFLITTNTSSPPAHNSSSSENPESSMETEVNGDSVEKSTGASDIYKLPCILVFDSLSGPARTSIVKTLREYLCVEWSAKKQTNRTFDRDTMRGGYPKVPQQNNFSDCGVYVLQFVETFFKKPIRDFSIPIKGLQDWFSEEEVSQKRGQLRDLILSLHQKNKLQSKPS